MLSQVHNALGFAYFNMERTELALRNYGRAVELQPGYVTAWNNLGDAQEKAKDWAQVRASARACRAPNLPLSPAEPCRGSGAGQRLLLLCGSLPDLSCSIDAVLCAALAPVWLSEHGGHQLLAWDSGPCRHARPMQASTWLHAGGPCRHPYGLHERQA